MKKKYFVRVISNNNYEAHTFKSEKEFYDFITKKGLLKSRILAKIEHIENDTELHKINILAN